MQRITPTPWITNKYPPARRSDHLDDYKSEAQGHVQVADPYQWLEKNTEETEEWVTAQEAFTRGHLDQASYPALYSRAQRNNHIIRTQIVSN
jgi:prolyl oligopeptidase